MAYEGKTIGNIFSPEPLIGDNPSSLPVPPNCNGNSLLDVLQKFDSGPEVFTELNVKMTFTPSRRKKVRKIFISIEGEFSMVNVSYVKSKILTCLDGFDSMDILLKNISQFDLAAVQLLHALKMVSGQKAKTLSIDSDFSVTDKSLLINSGLYELFSKPQIA